MSDIVRFHKLNETYLHVECDQAFAYDMSDEFSFLAKNYKFNPKVRDGIWDGRIRLFKLKPRAIYYGLIEQVYQFAKQQGRDVEITDSITPKTDVSVEEIAEFIKTLDLPFMPYDFQFKAIHQIVKYHRRLFLSATASGKSLMAYMVSRWYEDKKILIVCPTTNLVGQMKGDFEDYAENIDWNADEHIHTITKDAEKDTDKRIVITTWQGIQNMPVEYFGQYEVLIGDEAHLFAAKSLTYITESCINAGIRMAMTGTIHDEEEAKVNEITIVGLFGKKVVLSRAIENIKRGISSDLNAVKTIILKHPEWASKYLRTKKKDKNGETTSKRPTFEDEKQFIISNEKRNKFICDLTKNLKGNTMVLFERVEKHGHPLYEMMRKIIPEGRNVYYVHGGVDAEIRNKIRKIVESEDDAIIIASYGSFSTGTNIKRLHNLIFASPSKSRIRIMQSIGRLLRKTLDAVTVYDIADDFRKGSFINYTYKHMELRVEMYIKEEFPYEIDRVKLEYEREDTCLKKQPNKTKPKQMKLPLTK